MDQWLVADLMQSREDITVTESFNILFDVEILLAQQFLVVLSELLFQGLATHTHGIENDTQQHNQYKIGPRFRVIMLQ